MKCKHLELNWLIDKNNKTGSIFAFIDGTRYDFKSFEVKCDNWNSNSKMSSRTGSNLKVEVTILEDNSSDSEQE